MHRPRRLTSPDELRAPGVHLRQWRRDDLDAMVALFDDPDVARWTPMPAPFDLAAARAHLDRARQGRRTGERVQLAITTDGGAARGEVLLFGLAPDRSEAELGYVVGPSYRGQGLAGAALTLLAGYARDELKLRRLVLRIDPGNAASRAVAHRAGFRLTDDPPIRPNGPGGPTLHTWELSVGAGR
jgi:RimJ/RimL family protein N-acetyltransferase